MSFFKRKRPEHIAFPPMATYSTIGFSIFDACHIIFGLYFFERAFREKGETFFFDVAESATEIVCSILLLLFIIVIIKQNTQNEERHHYYTFAWLIACVSTFLPEIFKMVRVMEIGEPGTVFILCSVQVGLSLLSFSLFIAALFTHHENKVWGSIMGLAVLCFFSLVPLSIANTIIEASFHDGWWLMAAIIIDAAPFFPCAFALYSLIRIKHYSRRKKLENTNNQ
jgi:hypothetical protein